MKLTIDLDQSVIDRIKNKSDYDVPAIINAVDRALSEQEVESFTAWLDEDIDE